MNKVWPIKFSQIKVCDYEPLWKQILWFSFYGWDETPNAFTIRILSIDINFLAGSWEE